MQSSGKFKTHVVTFFGTKTDAHGMPEPYHSYHVLVTPWEIPGASPGAWVARIHSLSDAPMPEVRYFIGDGSDEAFKRAYDTLTRLPKNKGLEVRHYEHE